MNLEPRRNTYVGHRYVPKIFGEWNRENSYEGLSIVTFEGSSYTSKKRVPAGIDIKNVEYWVLTGNYNAQIEQYRQEVLRISNEVTDHKKDNEKDLGLINEKIDKHELFQEGEIIPARFLGLKYSGDETNKLQEIINYAGVNKVGILFEDLPIMTKGLVINQYVELYGNVNLYPVDELQHYILYIKSQVNFKDKLVIDGKRKSLYGIKAESFKRSDFNSVLVNNCIIYGFQFEKVGNNNNVKFNREIYSNNGHQIDTAITQVTTNGLAGVSKITTIDLQTPLPDYILSNPYAIYFIKIESEVYTVNKILSTTRIEVNIIDIGNNNSSSGTIFIGGGLNIINYGDNGVGHHGSITVSGNKGVGVNCSTLYAHEFHNFVAEGNGIGFSVDRNTRELIMLKPYFELNTFDMVINQFIAGTIISPTLNIERIKNIMSTAYLGDNVVDPRLRIISENFFNNRSTERTKLNPVAINVYPSMQYAVKRTTGTQEFKINNDKHFTTMMADFITIDYNSPNGSTISLSLKNNTETIEGSSSYSLNIKGNALIKIFKQGTEWKVHVFKEKRIVTTLSYPPYEIGETAIVNNIAYIGTGTSSVDDWKQITN